MKGTWHGVYKGPVPRLAGKGALLRIKGGKLFAQFDDIQQPEAYGWLEVLRCDFKIRPRGRGALWSNRLNPGAPARKQVSSAAMYGPYGRGPSKSAGADVYLLAVERFAPGTFKDLQAQAKKTMIFLSNPVPEHRQAGWMP